MGRRVTWIVVALLVCAPLVGLAVLSLAFSAEPTVTGSSTLTPALVSRAEQLLRQHNPRRARGEQVRVAEIEGSDVNLMASYAARRLGMAATVEIGEGHALVRASVPARSPFGKYLNVTATVPESTGVPHLTHVTAGSVPVPDTVANWALRSAVRRWYHQDGEQLAADAGEVHEGPQHKAPKYLSETDPQSAWSIKDGPGRFSYETNYLIDTDHGIIMDVEATPARLSQEIVAAKKMLARTAKRHAFRPDALAADKS